ncbi:hypothetical protein LY76DRAFT_619563 [Colletotrichum caudatum]|nr:hypothetical protein LY76DRAFT_619563 [Colletotrichum caudatum]
MNNNVSSTSTPNTDRTLDIFGATGRNGSETLKAILAKPDHPFALRIFVRSRDKLISMFPRLKTDDVRIIEAQVRVLQDTTKSIVTGLSQLKSDTGGKWKRPRVILLFSATWNKRFDAQRSVAVRWLIKNAFYYPYADLLRAHKTLQSEPELVKLLLVQPPAIIEEEASGYTISAESVRLAVSYADLGAAFAELVREEAYEEIGAVGVTSNLAKKGLSRYGFEMLYRLIRGLMASFIPGFWRLMG